MIGTLTALLARKMIYSLAFMKIISASFQTCVWSFGSDSSEDCVSHIGDSSTGSGERSLSSLPMEQVMGPESLGSGTGG